MKVFEATIWRSNPQLKNGGYEMKKTVEARTENSARKKFEAICNKTMYGGMSVIEVHEAALA